MTPEAALGLISTILSQVPAIAPDVAILVESIQSGYALPYVPVTPELHAAMDDLHARLNALALADRAAG